MCHPFILYNSELTFPIIISLRILLKTCLPDYRTQHFIKNNEIFLMVFHTSQPSVAKHISTVSLIVNSLSESACDNKWFSQFVQPYTRNKLNQCQTDFHHCQRYNTTEHVEGFGYTVSRHMV